MRHREPGRALGADRSSHAGSWVQAALMRSFLGTGQSFVEQLHPVPHRQRGAGLDMRQAADVGGGDDLGRSDSSAATLLPSSCCDSSDCRIE